MKIAALFAGIGGLEAGLHQSGHQTVVLAEAWKPAARVLAERFPDVENLGDVAQIETLPANVDLLTAGFPCQDLSQAGRTAGIGGGRSGLVDHVFRLLDGADIPWVLLENVSFMLHLDGGRAMECLVSAFEQRGYLWAYRVVNSLAFVPQRRERVFFLASRQGDPADVLLSDETRMPVVKTELDTHAHGFYWTEGIRGLGWAPDAIPTLKNGSTVGIASPPAILLPEGSVVTPEIRDAERLQGFPVDWTKPCEAVGRAAWRWSLVGNAVSVPVSAWVGRCLADPRRFDRAREVPLPHGARWPRAARWDGTCRRGVAISDFPVWIDRPGLARFLQHPASPLSARATAGFLERTTRSKLRFVNGFRERLRAHLERVRALDNVIGADRRSREHVAA